MYERFYSSAQSNSDSFDISDLGIELSSADDIYRAFWAFDYDNPQFLRLGEGYSYGYVGSGGRNIITDLYIDYGRSSVPQGSFDSTAQGIIAAARQQTSDYEQLRYIHDWIVNNTVYQYANTDYESEADGPLVYGRALCEGYSKAFMYLAQSLGFECVCVCGYAGGVEHMWNMVKLNGQWYNVDCTYDDPVMSDGSNTLRYNYFLISDWQIKRDHSFSTPFSLPIASSNYM